MVEILKPIITSKRNWNLRYTNMLMDWNILYSYKGLTNYDDTFQSTSEPHKTVLLYAQKWAAIIFIAVIYHNVF